VLKITPLHYELSLERILGTNYLIGVKQEAGRDAASRARISLTAAPGEYIEKHRFMILKADGQAEDPTLTIELADPKMSDIKQEVAVSKEKPYRRVDGYAADLFYPRRNLSFPNCRVGGRPLIFEGETNKIVEINANGVVLSDSSGKRRIINANN